MAKRGVQARDAVRISGRLKAFATKHFGSWEKFVAKAEIRPATANTWRRKKDAAVPDALMLLQLARSVNIDLNWLLLGEEGSDVRTRPGSDGEQRFESLIEAALKATEDATDDEFRTAWARLANPDDGVDTIHQLAVSGVRVRLQEHVRTIRHYVRIFDTGGITLMGYDNTTGKQIDLTGAYRAKRSFALPLPFGAKGFRADRVMTASAPAMEKAGGRKRIRAQRRSAQTSTRKG